MKNLIKDIKNNPIDWLGSLIFVSILSILFYISMWIFY